MSLFPKRQKHLGTMNSIAPNAKSTTYSNPVLKKSEISRRGHWKRAIGIKLSEIYLQIHDQFATMLRTLPLMYETKCRQFCANLADKFAQRPSCERPLRGISEKVGASIRLFKVQVLSL